MAISDELTLLATTKANIKTAINNKGGSVTNDTPFADYATAITNLPSGDNSTLIDLIERDITSINIPSGTTRIGKHAFYYCEDLTNVTIPNTVTSIGDGAFFACSRLNNVTIPSSVTSMYASQIFAYCTSLTSVTIPDSVTTIGQWLFDGCNAMREIIVGSGVTSIGQNGFSISMQNTSLQKIIVKATTPPTLGNSAFDATHNCPIYVPSVNAYKAASVWSNYASRIYGIETIATVDNTTVTNADLGNTDSTIITSLQVEALPSGTSLSFAEGVTTVNGQITGYTNVELPSTMTSLDYNGFLGSSVTTLTCNATTPPTIDHNNLGGANLTALYVPVESVDTYKAANGWSSFASIIEPIPVHVATLTLSDTSTVDLIDTTGFGVIDSYLTSQYASTTVGALIKSDTEGISRRAFRNFANLASVTFETGSQCTTIGQYAFQNCTSLTSITLPDLLYSIDSSAFSGCTSLETVTIGDNITEIGGSAFSGCESLTDITILSTVAPDGSGEDPFEGCDASITMHVPAASVETYQAWLNDDLGTAADITVAAIPSA